MFGLIRRISYSVIPRPDRPWEDDPTSNAPNTRRKRRISSTEHEPADDDEQTKKKKLRGEDTENLESEDAPSSPIVGAADASGTANEDTDVEADSNADAAGKPDTIQREGSLEVKVVTKGVNEVELEDKATSSTDKPTTTTSTTIASDDAPAPSSKNAAKPSTTAVKPEAIPLPEEKAGELDDIRSSSPAPESSSTSHIREDSATTAVDGESSEASEAPKVNGKDDSEIPAEVPPRSENPRQARSSRSAAKPSSSVKKIARSKSPKKVSTRA